MSDDKKYSLRSSREQLQDFEYYGNVLQRTARRVRMTDKHSDSDKSEVKMDAKEEQDNLGKEEHLKDTQIKTEMDNGNGVVDKADGKQQKVMETKAAQVKVNTQQQDAQADEGAGKQKKASPLDGLTKAILLNTELLSKLSINEQHKSTVKSPQFTPPSFEGGAEESFEQWVKELEEHFVYLSYDDGQKAKTLPMLLKGRARQFYQDLPVPLRADFDACLKRLSLKFGLPSKSPLHIYQQLDKAQGTETVRDYTKEIIRRLRNAYITDEGHQVAIFTRGLRPEIQAEVIKMRPNNMQEAEQFALVVEESLKLRPMPDVTNIMNDITKAISALNTKTMKQVAFQDDDDGDDQDGGAGGVMQTATHKSPGIKRNRSRSRSFDRKRSSSKERFSNTGRSGMQRGRGRTNAYRGYNNHPYCRQCDWSHPFGQHKNPTCSFCNRRGHVYGQCFKRQRTQNLN